MYGYMYMYIYTRIIYEVTLRLGKSRIRYGLAGSSGEARKAPKEDSDTRVTTVTKALVAASRALYFAA